MASSGAGNVRQFLTSGLSLLRGVTGDDAYDKYVAHMRVAEPQQQLMTAKEFFQAQMDQKWSCISGCC